ncbi:Holliday junction branch migration protein RuvA [Candidatus Microgenomates bacterium]|nr:Holliday junction branch migration protein RuvA [Candidatus Microgenomates bacterium]
MIGKVKGILSEVNGNVALIELPTGLFYEVFLPAALLASPIGQPIEIYTHFHVREDIQVLFGFNSKKEQDFFKLLIGVNGVGPKTAFQIVSFASADDMIEAVKQNDSGFFARVPGLGKKTALKIILELASKLDAAFELEQQYVSEEDKTVVDALVSLGFKSHDAKEIMKKLPKDLTLEQKIKEGLRLGSSK